MRRFVIAILLTIPLMLSSCANEFDVMMVESQMDAEARIAEAKAMASIAQAEALQATVNENMSDLERYFARLSIAGLTVTPSGIKSVTTGNDVLLTVTKDSRLMVKDIVTGTVLYKGANVLGDLVKSAGGNTNIEVNGDGNTTSTNKEDTKVVNIGDGTSSYKSGTGAGGSGTDGELEATECDGRVEEALAKHDMNNINLGGLMRRLSAETGCVVEIHGEQVIVVDSGNPVSAMNSHYAGHKDLGGYDPAEATETEAPDENTEPDEVE